MERPIYRKTRANRAKKCKKFDTSEPGRIHAAALARRSLHDAASAPKLHGDPSPEPNCDMKRYLPFIIVAIVAVVAVGAGAMLYRTKRAAMTSGAQPGAPSKPLKPEHVRGAMKAPVTLEEFGDFQCPACATVAGMLDPIEAEYGSNLRVVFWNFPLAMHKHGREAALAAEAASLQGQFWQMHDLLYEKQSAWSTADDVQPVFEQFATQLKLDTERFKKDYASVDVAARVDRQHEYGVSRGVKNTPTVFVNGRELPPPFNRDRIREAITAALPAAKS